MSNIEATMRQGNRRLETGQRMSGGRSSIRRTMSGAVPPVDATSHVLRRTSYGSESLLKVCGKIRLRTSLTNFIQAKPLDSQATFAALTKIHHPILARYHEFGFGPGPDSVWFSADSFLPAGRSLHSYIMAPQELSLTDKYVLALGMAIGLQVLHSEGILHGDFVPSTIIIETTTLDSVSHLEPHLTGYGLFKGSRFGANSLMIFCTLLPSFFRRTNTLSRRTCSPLGLFFGGCSTLNRPTW
jgi:serine/threonine protein kinase